MNGIPRTTPRVRFDAIANPSGLIFNPDSQEPHQFDPETRLQLRTLIDDVQVRDFSAHAVALLGKASSTPAQQEWG